MKIAFVAPPFAGHLNPLVPLALAARDAGHTVTITTGERKRAVLAARGLDTRSLASTAGDRLEAIANTARPVGSNPLRLLAQLRENLALLPAVRAELLAAWRADRPQLVVADSVAVVAGLAAEELGIPWVTTIATPFALENRRGVPAYCGGWSGGGGPWRAVRNAAGRRAVRAFKRLVGWRLRPELAALGLRSLYRADGSEAVYSSRAILGFGIAELELERDWPPAFRMIGPVIDAPERFPPLAFPGAPPARRVLVTLGTHLLWAKRDLVERARHLAAALPVVELVVSLGEPETADGSVARVAPGVSVTGFVPYARDLASFDAVVHHGGAGITYAAILHGKPSLVVPHDYDQFDFAARIEYHGLGRRSRDFDARALAELLAQPEWPSLARLQAAARAYRPVEAFMETVAAAAAASA